MRPFCWLAVWGMTLTLSRYCDSLFSLSSCSLCHLFPDLLFILSVSLFPHPSFSFSPHRPPRPYTSLPCFFPLWARRGSRRMEHETTISYHYFKSHFNVSTAIQYPRLLGTGRWRKSYKTPGKMMMGLHPPSWKVPVKAAKYRGVTRKSLKVRSPTRTKASASLRQSLRDLCLGLPEGRGRDQPGSWRANGLRELF